MNSLDSLFPDWGPVLSLTDLFFRKMLVRLRPQSTGTPEESSNPHRQSSVVWGVGVVVMSVVVLLEGPDVCC